MAIYLERSGMLMVTNKWMLFSIVELLGWYFYNSLQIWQHNFPFFFSGVTATKTVECSLIQWKVWKCFLMLRRRLYWLGDKLFERNKIRFESSLVVWHVWFYTAPCCWLCDPPLLLLMLRTCSQWHQRLSSAITNWY